MERRRRQDDGPWNRPHYGSAHSEQSADYYHEAFPHHQHTAYNRTGPYTDFPHGRPLVPWDSRAPQQNASQQQYAQDGNHTVRDPERGPKLGAMDPEKVRHGHSHSVGAHEAQLGMFRHGSARLDGPQPGFPPHMGSIGQRTFQHGGPQSGFSPHIDSTGQRLSQHGGPQSGFPPHIDNTRQRASQHGGPQSGIPPHRDIAGQGLSQHGGPQSGISPSMPSIEERISQFGIPPHMDGTGQRPLQHGGPQPGTANVEQGTSQLGGLQFGIPGMTSNMQRVPLQGVPQSGIPPSIANTEQRLSQPGGPQSGVFKHGMLQPRSIHYGGPQHEGQLLNDLQHKEPGQDTIRGEDSQQQVQSFQNTPQTGGPVVSSFGDSQPEAFNPTSLNKIPPNDMLHDRVPPPGIMQQSSVQLPPGPAQNIQHLNNPVQSPYRFPLPVHGPPLKPPAIPPFVHPPQMDAAFCGPPREVGQEVLHIQTQAQHPKGVLNQEPYILQRDEQPENAAIFNFHRHDNSLHQEMRAGQKTNPFTASEGTCIQNNPFFSKNSFQVGNANFLYQDVSDILQEHFTHQQNFEQYTKRLMNPNRQSEMLAHKEDSADKDFFQRWLHNFLACRRSKIPPKPGPVQSVSVPEARNLIYGALTLVSQLNSLCQCLENNKEGPSWAQDYEKAKELKVDLAKRIKELEKPGFIQCVKMKLYRIRKKRLRWQRNRQLKDQEEKEAAERVSEKEAKIDSWRMQHIQKVEEKKKERELKAAADRVLGEVRKKQTDAKKMLDMLKSLEKLRKLRKEAAARKGVSPPPSADETFTNHIARLRSMVHKRMALYDAEERALRVILEGEQEEERKREKDKRLRKQRENFLQKQRELDSLLFGDDEPLPSLHPLQPFRQYYLQAEHSVVSLVQIRREWDQFLAPPDHPDASSIPRGWVLPMPPSSEIWATALKQIE